MASISNFDSADRRCVYRPSGSVSASELAYMIAEALSLARERSMEEALIDISAMSGFESPGPAFRRWAVRFWSEEIGNRMRIAVVAREEHICPDKTGLLVAAEEGLRANIFRTEHEALAWLEAEAKAARPDA